jgi:hypothetical protein
MIPLSRRTFLSRGAGIATLLATGAQTIRAAPSDDLATEARKLLRQVHSPLLASFLSDWPTTKERRLVEPQSLPVLHWLPQARDLAPPFSLQFVAALVDSAPKLAWQRSYTREEVGDGFVDNYGWTELLGLQGPTPSKHLSCGVLLLGPHVTYPSHRHEAEEIYVPLAGTAEWNRGSKAWREQSPGAVIHHTRYEPHAMRTIAFPLLALYLWRSDNLAQKSRIDSPATT